MSLNSGERQVSPTIEGIRRDHIARYEFTAKIIPFASKVIDFACGIGYGSKIICDAGHFYSGFDIDSETIEYAKKHYISPNAFFGYGNGNTPGDLIAADVAISFETIEHIEDPRPLLKAFHKCSPRLIVSVPNESVMPWEILKGVGTAFHFRHYTKHEFSELLNECGWRVVGFYGQKDSESDVEQDVNGRTLIAVCERGVIPAEKPKGRHIAILGLGYSLDQYTEQTKRAGGRARFCDETWAINALGNVFNCDLVFHMDDVRIQEIRSAANPASNIAAMLKWIKTSKVPVVTSRSHPDYPALVEFPLEDVLNNLGHDYFNSTAAYAIAFAIHTGATKISCFGMDFTYPNQHQAEKGRACVEFWLGQAHARGIEIGLPPNSTLMDSNCPKAARLYGYDTLDVGFDMQSNGELKLNFSPRTELPTAEEIEKNYDHTAPISQQHLGKTS